MEMLRGSMKSEEGVSKISSRLSLHRNSLEVHKKTSKQSVSATASKFNKLPAKESKEILTTAALVNGNEKPSSPIKLSDDGSRVVKVSHIEIVEVDTTYSNVCFKPIATVVDTQSFLSGDSPPRRSSEPTMESHREAAKGKMPLITLKNWLMLNSF